MEFKGTKGKWHILEYLDAYVIQDDCTYGSNEILNWNEVPEQEAKANALLISKAPEMLEMLIRLRDTEEFSITDYMDLKQLIEEATKID